MSNKNQIKYRQIFSALLWELLNTDCNPYYRGIGGNNMYFLLRDFLHYLNLEKSLIRQSQINILIDEFLYLIDNDIIFNSNFRKHSNEIIFDIKNNKNDFDLIKLKNSLEIIFKNLKGNQNYIKALLGTLNSYLIYENYNKEYENYEKHIKKLKKITFIYINFLKNEIGISRKYLEFIRVNNLNKIDLSNNSIFEKGFHNLSKLFFSSDREYKIYFKINIGNIQANKKKLEKINIKYVIDEISNSNINYIDNINICFDGKDIKESFIKSRDIFIKSDENIFYVCVILKGKDIHSLYKIAKAQLNKIFDTFLYEFNALKLIISQESLITDEDRIYIINDGYNEYINRKKGNEKNIIALNKIINNKDYCINTKNKISNSIKYYKLFLSSENSDVKLLNLWIALESLFSNVNSNENSFDKLRSFIPKLISMNLMKNYFDEFQNFILHRIDMEEENNSKYNNHSKIRDLIQKKNKVKNKKTGIIEEKFNNVGIFKSFNKKDFLNIKDLLHNEYIIQKYQRLFNIVEKNNKGQYNHLHTFLKRYENNIKWILTKIYRYRNYIVHGGKGVSTDNITNDLEFIYLELIDDILEKIDTNYLMINSLEEYFSRINRSYNVYQKGINNRLPEHTISDSNLVLPFIVY